MNFRYIKGFDKNLCCRGYQFEIGKEYKIDLPEGYKLTEKDLCTNKVFHFCENLQMVHCYYDCNLSNRYCVIEALGDVVTDGEKCASNHIRIVHEIVGEQLAILKGFVNGNTGLFNTGNRNSGDYNTGRFNSGDCNIGNCNIGSCNIGNCNIGGCNVGSCNIGNRNIGVFNLASNSTGVFCTETPKISIFNMPSNYTLEEFMETEYYEALRSSFFRLTTWDEESNKLIQNSYTDACRLWWANMTPENKAIIKSMPNFDIDIFCEITGIKKEDV